MSNRVTGRGGRTPASTTTFSMPTNRERSIIRRPHPPPSSATAIIEGLRQGNALELQTFQTLEEGLTSLIAGLRNEGYNRSDALDELSENMGMLSLDLAAEQKTSLASMISDGIRDCERAKDASREARNEKLDEIDDMLDDDLVENSKLRDRMNARNSMLSDMYGLLMDLSNANASRRVRRICDELWREYDALQDIRKDDDDAWRSTRDAMYDRAMEQKREADKEHDAVVKRVRKSICDYRRIAKALGVEHEV